MMQTLSLPFSLPPSLSLTFFRLQSDEIEWKWNSVFGQEHDFMLCDVSMERDGELDLTGKGRSVQREGES